MSPARYRHVVWDWNGTLLDDLDYSIGIMNGLLARRGLPLLDRRRYHEQFDFPVRDYYYRIGFDPVRDPFEQLSVEFISGYDAQRWGCALQPCARELLTAVTQSGITQSILSAYRHETLHEIVDHFGLKPHFIRLTGLDNIYAASKADLGLAWIKELGLPPKEVLLVGDTLHDLDVARHMGTDCVLVAAGHHPSSRLRARHDWVVENLAELAVWFAGR